MGLRQLLKQAVKPAAMATIAGGLALSLVVTTPSNAQAFVPPVPLPVVFGATQMVLPELMATSAVLGPVGWTIAGLTVLGVGLYATRDYWVPYVTGAFGNPKTDVPYEGVQPGTMGTDPNLKLSGGYIDGRSTHVNLMKSNQPSSGFFSWTVAVRFECRWDNGSANTVFNSYHTQTNVTFPWPGKDLVNTCSAVQGGVTKLGVPVGVEWGLVGTGQFIPYASANHKGSGPANYLSAGGFGINAFDPRSPDVKYENTVECIRPDGSKFTLMATSHGADGGLKMPSCEAASPGSHGTGKQTVVGFAPGSTKGETVWDVQAPTADPNKPLCSPTRPGTGCKLQILLDTSPCVVGMWECENWLDLSKDPNWTPRFSCQYGPYSVPLETCNPLERGYEPDGAPASEENTDGDPSTANNTDPAGNPQTGEPPVTSTVPGGASPAPVGTVPGTTVQAAECFPTGWGMLNPFEWVLKPIACAFIPQTNLQARAQNTVNSMAAMPPFSWFSSINPVAPGGASCPNWHVDIGPVSYDAICDSSFTEAIRGSRNLIFTMLGSAMVWPLIRSLWYASIPFIRVQPGSSK